MPASDLLATLPDGAPTPLPPVGAPTWVWVLGLALVAGVACWYLALAWFTRTRRTPPRASASRLERLRAEHRRALEAAGAEYAEGTRDLRALHLELGQVLRSYATGRTGVDAASLTAAEVGRLPGARDAAAALAAWAEPSFARESDAEATAALARAREVIDAW